MSIGEVLTPKKGIKQSEGFFESIVPEKFKSSITGIFGKEQIDGA